MIKKSTNKWRTKNKHEINPQPIRKAQAHMILTTKKFDFKWDSFRVYIQKQLKLVICQCNKTWSSYSSNAISNIFSNCNFSMVQRCITEKNFDESLGCLSKGRPGSPLRFWWESSLQDRDMYAYAYPEEK